MGDEGIQKYIDEYLAEGIGQNLYELIFEVVKQECRKYPPVLYSPYKSWDKYAISGLAHDFMIEKLIGKGWLEHHLYTQETINGLRQALRRDLRHFLISKKEKSEISNLYGRVKKILKNNDHFKSFYPSGKFHLSIWGLSEWIDQGKSVEQNLEKIVEAMFSVKLPPLIRYKPESEKLSHLISNDDLERLLIEIFEHLKKSLSLSMIIEALRYRLGVLSTEFVKLQDSIKVGNVESNLTYEEKIPSLDQGYPEKQFERSEIVNRIYQKLSDRQRKILACRLCENYSTYEDIGKQLGISKSTVQNEIEIIVDMMKNEDINHRDAEDIIMQLSDLCYQYLNNSDQITK